MSNKGAPLAQIQVHTSAQQITHHMAENLLELGFVVLSSTQLQSLQSSPTLLTPTTSDLEEGTAKFVVGEGRNFPIRIANFVHKNHDDPAYQVRSPLVSTFS